MKTWDMTSMERCPLQRWTGMAMLKGMVEQEVRDFVRFRSELHKIALELGSVLSVMVRLIGSRLLRSFFGGG